MNTYPSNFPTPSALRKLTKSALIEQATQACLLEHLDTAEVQAMTKAQLLAEVDGALLRAEVAAEYDAAMTDNVVELAPKAARKARKAASVEPAPKAKRSKATGTADANQGGGVQQHPNAKTMTPEQVVEVGELHDAMVEAIERFEVAVVEMLEAGASPSHVGVACGLGNSSIRRILWRRKPETAPKS